MMNDKAEMIQTELDSHANMVIVGKHCHILAKTGRHVDMNPFTPAYKALKAPIVYTAIQYDCPYEGKSYILIITGAIYIPSMTNNWVPPFVLREVGIVVNDKAKINTADPTNDDHAPLQGDWLSDSICSLGSILLSCEGNDVYILTSETWHPHSNAYVHSKGSMVDWEGNICAP